VAIIEGIVMIRGCIRELVAVLGTGFVCILEIVSEEMASRWSNCILGIRVDEMLLVSNEARYFVYMYACQSLSSTWE
jgi:hypothetical protein